MGPVTFSSICAFKKKKGKKKKFLFGCAGAGHEQAEKDLAIISIYT